MTLPDPVTAVFMNRAEAEDAVAAINQAATDIAQRLADLRDLEGWRALNFSSWTACLESDLFTYSRQHLYAIMRAAPVQERLVSLGYKLPLKVADLLSHYPEPLQLPIVQAATNRYGKLTEGRVKSVGDVLTQAVMTGHVDLGDGTSTALDAALDKEDDEREKRQRQHIEDSTHKQFVTKLAAVASNGLLEMQEEYSGDFDDGEYEVRIYRVIDIIGQRSENGDDDG